MNTLIPIVFLFILCVDANIVINDQIGAQSYSKGFGRDSFDKNIKDIEKYDNPELDKNYEYIYNYRNQDTFGVNGRGKDLYGELGKDFSDERKNEELIGKQTAKYYGKEDEERNGYIKEDGDFIGEREYNDDKDEYVYGKIREQGIYNRREFEEYGKKLDPQEYYDDKEFNLKSGAYVGNPDDFSKYELPCQNYDIYCIRNYFAKHARCEIARGPVPDPLYRAQSSIYIPNANLSVILTNVEISGLNGRVTVFYVNKVTNNLIMATEFKGLKVTAEANLEFFRTAQEPVVTITPIIYTFPSFEITTVIPNKDDLQLEKSENVAFNMAPPVFAISPSALVATSLQQTNSFTEALANLNTSIQEYFLTDAVFFASSYIQYNICDFHLKVF